MSTGDRSARPLMLKDKHRKECQYQQRDFWNPRVTQTLCSAENSFELRQFLTRYEAGIHEFRYGLPNRRIDYDFRQNQERQTEQKASVHREVGKKRNCDLVTKRQTIFHGKDQKGQPRDGNEQRDPTQNIRETHLHESHAEQEVVDRASDNDRKSLDYRFRVLVRVLVGSSRR